MTKLVRLFVAASAASLLLVGCGKSESGGGFSKLSNQGKENTFRYTIVTSPTTLDPHRVEDGDTIDMLSQVYEGLVAWSPKSEVEPAIAESWEIKDGGTTYVFKIREGVKFHDGKALTAEDCKWSLERACNPKLASPVAVTYLDAIVGVREKFAGTAPDIKGVTVTGPFELTVKIDKPRPYFLAKLTYLTSAVLPKDSVAVDKEIAGPFDMIGTGPFKMASYVPDSLVKQVAFKDYWGGEPKLLEIERPVVKDAEARLNKYRSGEVDLVQLERQQIDPFLKDPKYKDHVKYFDRPAIWYVGFSPKGYKPFADVRVRRAFAMAINRDVIVNELLGGVNKIATGILPPGVAGARETVPGITYNPAEAKSLLASAGFADGKGLPPLEFNFRDNRPDIKSAAVRIAEDLKTNLGVSVNIRSMEWGAYLEKRNRGELQLFHMRWGADYLDPENFLSLLLTTNGAENKIGYSNPKVDTLCAQADVMDNGPDRWSLYAQAEDLILQDAPWLPLYFQRDAELINPRVTGLRESLFGHLPHTTVELKN
ncbi:MAG: peptide ABC transporter substrate-binding protein [Chthonomonas sp.]|nr:peptide ABC transporter substrate-binding protein [Chthonomonas sp.]